MILLWGLFEDDTMKSVFTWLKRLNADLVFLNHAAIDQTRIDLSIQSGFSYSIVCEEQSCRLESLSAAYLRPYDYRQYDRMSGRRKETQASARANVVHHCMNTWAEYSGATIVNRPSAEGTNHSKLYQAKYIAASGFRTPDSMVTTDPERILEFQARHKRIVYKSMSGIRSIVREFSANDLKGKKIGPVLFQQRVIGRNIRVHVVGEQCMSCLIESDGVDHRYAPSRVSPIKVEDNISHRCVALTQKLGLLVSGIDLIVAPTEEWYCLEVNPNPGFSYYDRSEEMVVARAVAVLLMNGIC